MSITLPSGFSFDYDNLFNENAVTAEELAELAPKLKEACEAIGVMRKNGVIRGHLSKDGTPEKVLFSQLPYIADDHLNSEATLAHLAELTDSVRNRVDAVVSLGIGGSYLGNRVLFDVKCGEFWNSKTAEERGGMPEIYFSGQNIDPRRTRDLINHLKHKAAISRSHRKRELTVLLLVISKSGGTLDTMSNFMVVYDELKKCQDISIEVVAVTDPNTEKPTLLKKLAMEQGWPQYSVPDGVGGRFSVFCDVGLTMAACVGFDIRQFLAGARAMDEACLTDDVMKNPALLNAALKYLAGEKHGRDLEVMMPYGDYLKSLSEWYIQLLAESLGKGERRSGEHSPYGRTPIVAVGTTDMHAQTQQHQEGKLNKVVQFIRVADWEEDYVVPDVFPSAPKLSEIAGVTMSAALEVARAANAQALKEGGRYSAVYTLPKLNEYHLGELMYMLALSVAYEGELADVDAFNQPGVEAYKRIMGPGLKAAKEIK